MSLNILQLSKRSIDDPGLPSTSFLILCSAFVFLMVPGLGLFYSGLSNYKNALSNIMIVMLVYCVVAIQWLMFGFSLSFSETGSPFIGNFDYAGLNSIEITPLELTAPQVPGIAFSLYQLQFAGITVAIIFGSVAERFRILPALVFSYFWTTLVYDVVAYWTWGARGWLRNMSCLSSLSLDSLPCGKGSYDYAGGGPVHVASGFAALAYCLIVGQRKSFVKFQESKPHNLMNVFLGTSLIWFGWFGFNGGSAIASSPRAALSAMVTLFSSVTGALFYCILDFFKTQKWSLEKFCTGAVAGLVIITPASGYIAPWAAFVMSILGILAVRSCINLKHYFGFDDTLDAFGIHGVGGVVGGILTGVFADSRMAEFDKTTINGGWINNHFDQIGYQIAATLVIAVYSFFISSLLLLIIDRIPGLHLRISEKKESSGLDISLVGEDAYLINNNNHNKTEVSTRDSFWNL